MNRKLDSRQNEYNLIKSLVDNLEGFPEAIRFLKTQNDWGKDAPLLSDILTCDEKFRVTIENYLEPYMNYYVVESMSDAFHAVNLLSEASKGRAHFFILDAFNDFVPTPIRFYDHSIPASEITEYDSKYNKLVSYIFDNTYLYSGPLQDLPRDSDAIFISSNGKMTKRRFSLSGGSVGLFEGKRIGRAKNLEKLEKEIGEINNKLEAIKQQLTREQHELALLKNNTHREKISSLQTEISQLSESLVSFKTRKEQYAEMLSDQSTRKEDLTARLNELELNLDGLRPQEEARKIEIENLLSVADNLQKELKAQHETVELRMGENNQENLEYHQFKSRLENITQEISFKTSSLESSRERVEKNITELQRNENEIRELTEISAKSEEEILVMYRTRDEKEAGLNESERQYYSARGHIDEMEKSTRDLQHSREQVDTLLMEYNNNMSEVKLQLSSMKERLSVEFEVNLDEVMSAETAYEENLTEPELHQEVTAVKEKIDRLGPINPMAMDAYNEIKERYEFISTQRDDLLNAKDSLKTTMDEIDQAAQANFMEAYHGIKENFVKVFRTLFNDEDDCDLVILNPEDPLNSGIEIIAKPKGKRPLTINQLSGGEKTLTATSLLFAIYLMKPAPFCIFDEVDAPLDDINLDKFNKIIRTFSKDSQFIIVTHNKRTMSASDIIYGITMVEEGVSRVVPVDLRELEVEGHS